MQNRVIPILLYKKNGLYKGVKFKDYKYIGDPLNAIRVFSEKEVDELVLFDIEATKENRSPNLEFIEKVAEECYMPFAVGGGIKDLETIRNLLKAGAEKVIINSAATQDLEFIKKASIEFGSTSIVVCIDYKKNIFNKFSVYSHSGNKKTKHELFDYANRVEAAGAGELILNSISSDGKGLGMDRITINKIVKLLSIPVIASGGVGNKEHIYSCFSETSVAAIGAGSFFVFNGPARSVLITYKK
jgi:cyclase